MLLTLDRLVSSGVAIMSSCEVMAFTSDIGKSLVVADPVFRFLSANLPELPASALLADLVASHGSLRRPDVFELWNEPFLLVVTPTDVSNG